MCGVEEAVGEANATGLSTSAVLVLGHSSGGQLAALAALQPERYRGRCPDAPAPDGLVGLAGTYDLRLVPDLAQSLIGSAPGDAPEIWREANPVLVADRRPQVPALLLHGADDRLVPTRFTTGFADALRRGGHPVEVGIVPGHDHHSIYRPEAVGGRVVSWIRSLPG